MKKHTNPSKVIIAPNPPKPKNQEECVPDNAPVAAPEAPAQAPAQQQTEVESDEEEKK